MMKDPMIVYAIRHKDTKLYYAGDRNPSSQLSKFPSIYVYKPEEIETHTYLDNYLRIEGELAREYNIKTKIEGHERLTLRRMKPIEFEIVEFRLEEVAKVSGSTREQITI